MPLNAADRNAVRAAITNGTPPVFARDTLQLQLAAKRIVLAQANGRKTLAELLRARDRGTVASCIGPRSCSREAGQQRVSDSAG